MEKDLSTENRIKEAAREIFHEKGYKGTRTRDIAEAVGMNTALLNYYFRSKENLFNIIMMESIHEMFAHMTKIIHDEESTLMTKIDHITNKYIDVIIKTPNLPLFVLSEMQADPDRLLKTTQAPMNQLRGSYLFEQLQKQIDKESLPFDPIQIFINIISMSILPIVGNALLKRIYMMDDETFLHFIEERRTFIPMWIAQMLKLTE